VRLQRAGVVTAAGPMTRRTGFWVAVVLAAVGAATSAFWFARDVDLPAPVQRVVEGASPGFVGAERCASCHAPEFAAWRASTHGRAGGAPSAVMVLAPFVGASIEFADARVTARVRGGSYEFVVVQSGEPEQVFRVDGVVGGGHIYGGGTQGFVTRIDGTLRLLPFEWSRQERGWFCNASRSGGGFAPITRSTRLADCGDWPPDRVLGDLPRLENCQSCHASQAVVTLDTARHGYVTSVTSLAINCESCHGPAQRHVELAERGSLGASSDIGLVSLATADKDGSLTVCWQCHAVKSQTRPGFVSGRTLADHYSLRFATLGDRPLHPDGRTRTFAYQEGHLYSACYFAGGMTCASCHDPHSQQYRSITREPLVGRFNNGQCLACHASKADVPTHTFHRATSAGSNCTACHMPLRQQPETRGETGGRVVPYERSDHTISIPRPSLDSTLGFTSACAACHQGKSVADLEREIRAWWGETRPVAAPIAAQLRWTPAVAATDAARQLLDSGVNVQAAFAGLSRYLETYVAPDRALDAESRRRLRLLAAQPDVDIRAAALASLHLAEGADRGRRRELARALRDAGDSDAALRERWVLALGFKADGYAANGSLADALVAYRRALEIQPRDPRLYLNYANALRANDLPAALTAYRTGIALDGTVPLLWVNYGIALGAAGDTVSAIEAFTRAATLDAGEALAWYNLANIVYMRRDFERAAALYTRALAADQALAPANFQLARIALMRRDDATALRYLRRGLAFDASDATGRELAGDLARRLGR
jgi:tetratricopeptide (TPR) repeat protein